MRLVCLLLAASLTFGCSKSKKKEEAEAETKPDVKEKPAKVVDEAENQAVDKLMQGQNTEEDFEEQADKEITEENLKAELEKLEKEVAAEEAAEGITSDDGKMGGSTEAKAPGAKSTSTKALMPKPAGGAGAGAK